VFSTKKSFFAKMSASNNNNINNLDQHQSNFASTSPNVCGGGRSTQPRSTIEPPQQQQQARSTFSANNNNIGSSNLNKVRIIATSVGFFWVYFQVVFANSNFGADDSEIAFGKIEKCLITSVNWCTIT
jgi:hypothetical protein